MIILRQKTYTRSEQEAMSEIKNWLCGQGKRGIKIRNAREFLNARNLANTTADALRYQKMPELKGNEQQILQSLGLNKTAKAYAGIMRKHTNPELLDRWERIYGSHFKNRVPSVEDNENFDPNYLKTLLNTNRNTKKEINRRRKRVGAIRKKQIFVKSLLDKYGSLDKVGEVRGWTDEQRSNAERLLGFTPAQFKSASRGIRIDLEDLKYNQNKYRVYQEEANRRAIQRKKQDTLFDASNNRKDWIAACKAEDKTWKNERKFAKSGLHSPKFLQTSDAINKRVPVRLKDGRDSKGSSFRYNIESNLLGEHKITDREILIGPKDATLASVLHENGHASSSFLRPDLKIKADINKDLFNTTTYLDNSAAEDIQASRNEFANNLDRLAEEGRATYGALAKARQMRLPRKDRKQIRRDLSACFGTYSTDAAKDLIRKENTLDIRKNL